MTLSGAADPVVGPSKPRLLGLLGPGLITGASDDDPSGIATYSQAGAQLGFNCLWMMVFSYPLMAVTQEISARIGRTTGHGLAGVMRRHCPAWLAAPCILLLLIANIINLGADLSAMGDVAAHLCGAPKALWVIGFGAFCLGMQVFLQYTRYVAALKWLTLALFAYFGTMLMIRLPWDAVAHGLVVPHIVPTGAFAATLVAVLGTTISPYLFFWQSSQEAEDLRTRPTRTRLKTAPQQARRALRRIRLDTYIGMGFSNVVALAIIITAAGTLHARGVTDVQTSVDAAKALEPIAGPFAYALFSLGIIATGLMAVPVLAGSAAYGLAEARNWRVGLARDVQEAKAFYASLTIATVLGILLNFAPINPIQALFWSAVLNGVAVAPIIAVMMVLADRQRVMGEIRLPWSLRAIGWLTVGVMAASVVALAATAFGSPSTTE